MSPKAALHAIDVARELKTGPALRLEIETPPSPQSHTLPNDVLIHIFVLISQDHGPVVFPIRNHEAPPQLVLSQVCSRWRTLALSIFELWNNLCLVNRRHVNRINLISLPHYEWLSRVGSSPIELSLRSAGSSWRHATDRDDLTAARIIHDTVACFELQVKTLHIDLTFRQFKVLSSFPNPILPHIERLELEFDSYDVRETFSTAPIDFTRLRSVVLSERHYFTSLKSDVLLNVSLPWSQLRSLMLYFKARVTPVFDTLRQMPLLQELHLCIRLHSSDHLASLKELTIPSLRRLRLEFFIIDENTNKVFRNITCPGLVELDIKGIGSAKNSYEIIKQQYNLQGLEELSLLNHIIPVSSILKDAPKLQRLRIRGDTIDDKAIAGLSNGTLGRCLKELTAMSACDMNRLLSMVEMRKRMVDGLVENGRSWRELITVLRTVGVYYGKDSNERKCGYKERVDALKEVGITVTLPEEYM